MAKSEDELVSMNVSCTREVRDAVNKIPRREFRTRSAYVCHVVTADLERRRLLKKRK